LIHFYKRFFSIFVDENMPQGKLKTKTNTKPPAKKSKVVKKSGILKKGRFSFTAKKNTQQQIQKFKKEIQKGINANIEEEIKAIAVKDQEGKPLKSITSGKTTGSCQKPKEK